MKRIGLTLAGTLALALPLSAAPPSNAWLHVHVEESGPKPSTVKVNLPVSLIEHAAPFIQEQCSKHTTLKAGNKEFDKAQLQSIWNAVKAAEDGEFVSVANDEENVSVAKSKDHLLVNVREKGDKGESVDVRMPMSVADALLGGTGEELDVMAAIRVLAREGHGELVTVRDKSNVVRIWIDAKNVAD
jgi:hypothetical protein